VQGRGSLFEEECIFVKRISSKVHLATSSFPPSSYLISSLLVRSPAVPTVVVSSEDIALWD
jgi:hypothetical protein